MKFEGLIDSKIVAMLFIPIGMFALECHAVVDPTQTYHLTHGVIQLLNTGSEAFILARRPLYWLKGLGINSMFYTGSKALN